MTARNPIQTFAATGLVGLVMDVDTAVALADSIEFGVASGGLSTVGRELGRHDVEAIRDAAARAAAAADRDVPILLGDQPKVPQLRLVGGEDRC